MWAAPSAPRKHTLTRLARLWCSFDRHVGRRDDLLSGLLLAALKMLGDSASLWFSTGRLWDAAYCLQPVRTLLSISLADAPLLLLPVLALWTLPFLWVGVSLSVRRAIDAGMSPWLGLLFFAPLVSYVVLAGVSRRQLERQFAAVGLVSPAEFVERIVGASLENSAYP
jgi:uncharacterized membrane protein YhaH (DUF805 family)